MFSEFSFLNKLQYLPFDADVFVFLCSQWLTLIKGNVFRMIKLFRGEPALFANG
jgi:hypothetical protein